MNTTKSVEKKWVGGGEGVTLDPRSPYERLFGVVHRRPGRPEEAEPVFPAGGLPAPVVDVARRRAFAVLHEEGKGRLAELFLAEAAVLHERFSLEMEAIERGQ